LTLKKYGELGRDEKSATNAPSLSKSTKDRLLACRERGTLQARYPLWFTIRLSAL